MDQLLSCLPPAPGLLPKWLLLVRPPPIPSSPLPPLHPTNELTTPQLAAVSIGNSAQSYLTLSYTRRVYNNPTPSASQATPLSSRTFGTWTLLASIVRAYAAYHIDERAWYELAMLTYAVAAWHFGTEWLVFRTANMGEGLVGPMVVSLVSLGWMWVQWDGYVGA